MSIDEAKEEAHRLRGLAEKATDPQELVRQQQEAQAAADSAKAAQKATEAQQEARQAATVGDAWAVYLADRQPIEANATTMTISRKPVGQPIAAPRFAPLVMSFVTLVEPCSLATKTITATVQTQAQINAVFRAQLRQPLGLTGKNKNTRHHQRGAGRHPGCERLTQQQHPHQDR